MTSNSVRIEGRGSLTDAQLKLQVGDVPPGVENIFGRFVDPRALDAERVEKFRQLAPPAADF